MPLLSATVRLFHDVEKSGYWTLALIMMFLRFIGSSTLIQFRAKYGVIFSNGDRSDKNEPLSEIEVQTPVKLYLLGFT